MPYKIKKQKCKMKSGEPGEAVRYRKVTHGDGSVSLKKAACHKSVPAAYAAIANIHSEHHAGDELSEDLYESIINRILATEALKPADVRSVETAVKSFLNPAARVVKKGNHIRIHDDTPYSEEQKISAAEKIAADGLKMQNPKAQNAGILQNVSGKYDTYRVKDDSGGEVDIIFAGTKVSGLRKGGYKYESDLITSLKKAGIYARGGGTTETDIFVLAPALYDINEKPDPDASKGNKKDKKAKKLDKATVGIETKLIDAAFGQPTLQYNFASKSFMPIEYSRSKESAELVCSILNADRSQNSVHDWMLIIKKIWDSAPENPYGPMDFYASQVTIDAFKYILAGKLSLAGKLGKQTSPAVTAAPDLIQTYYMNKGADYIQINPSGLYYFRNVLGLDTKSFMEAASEMRATIKIQMLESNGKMMLRANINLPLDKLPRSNMSLDNPQDVEKFMRACWGESEYEAAPEEVREEGLRQFKALLSEKLSREDRREVDRIMRRAIQDQMDFSSKGDLSRLIRSEVDRALSSREVTEEIESTAEDVLRRLMKELLK